jgi:hypothetical protein
LDLSDYDADLLSVAASRDYATKPGSLQTQEIDLAANLKELPFHAVDAITTSAFLDLVSQNSDATCRSNRLIRKTVFGQPDL